MQLADAPNAVDRRQRGIVSPILELNWTLLAATSEHLRTDHPALQALYARAGVIEEVTGFWGCEPPCYPEMIVLAHRAGALESDLPDALVAMDVAAAMLSGDLPLRTETPTERLEILRRLDVLRTEPSVRRTYFALLSAVWEQVAGEWERVGRPLVTEAAREMSPSTDWHQLLREACTDVEPWLTACDGWRDPDGAVVIAPCYFSGMALLVDVPGLLIVGNRFRTEALGRARFEALGRQLKSVADPTRLAILARAADGPVLIGGLARDLGLAQPTVSNHVKVLREAGLLVEARAGGRRNLVLDRVALAGVSDALVREVAQR